MAAQSETAKTQTLQLQREMENAMKGKLISQEFNKMAWVKDKKGAEYVCYLDQNRDVKSKDDLSKKEQRTCMNLNTVLGDSW